MDGMGVDTCEISNKPLVQYLVRFFLYLFPFVCLFLAREFSGVAAFGVIFCAAAILWKYCDYDIQTFPLLVKIVDQIKNISEMDGYFFHRLQFTVLPFAAFYGLLFFILRDTSPQFFYNLILHQSYVMDLAIGYIDNLPKELATYQLKEKYQYLSDLKSVSNSYNFYIYSIGDYIFVEIFCIFFNLLFMSLIFEFLSIVVFFKKLIDKQDNFFKYYHMKYRIFVLTPSVFFLLFFLSLSIGERLNVNDEVYIAILLFNVEVHVVNLIYFLTIMIVCVLFFIFENYLVIAYFLYRRWFHYPF